MDGELVDIVLRFQKLQENAARVELRIGKLALRRVKEELAALETAILEEIDQSTERAAAAQGNDRPANGRQSPAEPVHEPASAATN